MLTVTCIQFISSVFLLLYDERGQSPRTKHAKIATLQPFPAIDMFTYCYLVVMHLILSIFQENRLEIQ